MGANKNRTTCKKEAGGTPATTGRDLSTCTIDNECQRNMHLKTSKSNQTPSCGHQPSRDILNDRRGSDRITVIDESSLSPHLRQQQVEVCSLPQRKPTSRESFQSKATLNRLYFDDHHRSRITTNVAVLKMLLLFAAMVIFSIGAYAIKTKKELMDLRVEYRLALSEIQHVQLSSTTMRTTDSKHAHVINLLLSEIHEFDDEMDDMMQSNHGLEKSKQDMASFIHVASMLTQHWKEDAEDAYNVIDFLCSRYRLLNKKLTHLTQELDNARASLRRFEGGSAEQQNPMDESTRGQLKKSKNESSAIDENHLLRKQLYNTTSFLHIAIYYIQELNNSYDELMSDNDYLYERLDKMAKERTESYHSKIVSVSNEKQQLEKRVNKTLEEKEMALTSENHKLQKQLNTSKTLLHLTFHYIQELKDVMSDNDFLYELVAKVGKEKAEFGAKITELSNEKIQLEQQLKLAHDNDTPQVQEKEMALTTENHKLRKQMYSTASFLHMAIYLIQELNISYDDLMRDNDFIYERIAMMGKERHELHEKIVNLSNENSALKKLTKNMEVKVVDQEKDKEQLILDDDNEIHLLRDKLNNATALLHFGIYYIRHLHVYYEDIEYQNEFFYEKLDMMVNELNRTRACLKVHPNPQWDEVEVEEKHEAGDREEK